MLPRELRIIRERDEPHPGGPGHGGVRQYNLCQRRQGGNRIWLKRSAALQTDFLGRYQLHRRQDSRRPQGWRLRQLRHVFRRTKLHWRQSHVYGLPDYKQRALGDSLIVSEQRAFRGADYKQRAF